MKIYEGTYLTINFEKENDRFIQFWTTPPNSVDSFKEEMLIYTSFYEQHKPSQTLWLQQKFTLDLDTATHIWIEENVNIPCSESGNKKAAFVVGKDVLAHLSVINSFEKVDSVINVNHFASEKDARSWLNNELTQNPIENQNPEITYEGVDEDGNSIIKIKGNSKDITNTIKSFKNIAEENDFIKSHIDKYSSLTKREIEIFKLYSKDKNHQEIATHLFLSLHTVRTHWKNIKKKLVINSFSDIIKYAKAFDL
jgi:DNA-binding CsgD family transcriptional regulator